MFYNLSFNSILVLVIGALLLAAGGYYRSSYYFAAGLILAGVGSILCGLTNGFSDYSPRGRILRKIGLLALIIGLPLTLYNLYRLV